MVRDVLAKSSRDDRQMGQGKMSQVLDAFGLLDFTMLRPILGARFETYEPLISSSSLSLSLFYTESVNTGA
jgi:hypothetical protein